jgi:hypothetical protein
VELQAAFIAFLARVEIVERSEQLSFQDDLSSQICFPKLTGEKADSSTPEDARNDNPRIASCLLHFHEDDQQSVDRQGFNKSQANNKRDLDASAG